MDKETTLLKSGLFRVDPDGTIWRIAKRHGRGVMPGGGYYQGATISPCTPVRAEYQTRDGYLLVCATINQTKTTTSAHRLAWVATNVPIPAGMTINHKDGVKTNNRPENLELATMSE
ncbi:MAG: HNH endonuclease [Alphaproteobacteria bacterium]|nr:HNH endonuclease [Alphaproteobacteria bacterium]